MSGKLIGPGEFMLALGATRSAFYRARGRGEIPAPDGETLGGHARWKVATVAKVLRSLKKTVPRSWGVS